MNNGNLDFSVDFVLKRLNVSGLRGLVGEEINPETIKVALDGFISYLKPKTILIAEDTRNSSSPISMYIKGYLQLLSINIIDLEIVPTPTLLFNVKNMEADGGIMITASHNPLQYNALKFVKRGGYFLNNKDVENIKSIILSETNFAKSNSLDNKAIEINTLNDSNNLSNNNFNQDEIETKKYADYKNIGNYSLYKNGLETHISKLESVFDFNEIKKNNFKVALDLCNGTAIYSMPVLLNRLNVKYDSIFDSKDLAFQRTPEPNEKTLSHLSEFMKNKDYDVGFAFDPDADRIVTMLKNGKIISEEFTLAFAFYYYVKYLDGKDIVINLSTSSLINKIAQEFNSKIYYAPVGEINVTEKMIKENVQFGGEGNGGVIFFPVSNSRDTLVASIMILSLLSKQKDVLDKIYNKYKNIKMYKNKIELKEIFKDSFNFNNDFKIRFYEKLENLLKKEIEGIKNLSNIDGIRLDFDTGFVHVRFSNTEPIMRIIIEKTDEIEANKLNEKIKSIIAKVEI